MHKSWMWKQRSYREQFQGTEGAGSTGGAAPAAETPTDDQQQAAKPEGETPEASQQAAGEGANPKAEDEDEAEDEVVITIDGVTPAPGDEETDEQRAAPEWVKNLRKEHREVLRQKRELEQKLAQKEAANAPGAIVVGEKPTLEGCDFDADRFETELTAWHERKRQADEQAAAARKEQETAQAEWQARLTAYKDAGAALKVSDFADAEATAQSTFNPTQLGIIVNGADNPAALVYALGKNPAKAKELAAIKDPVKYAFAVAKLETQLKVTPRKAPPPAERQVRGGAAGTSMDATLERLEAEADRTGDRSKVIAYKREQRAKQAA